MKKLYLLFTFLVFPYAAFAGSLVPASKLFSSSYMSAGDFSPDGKYLSVIVNNPEGRYLSIVETSTNKIENVRKFGSRGFISDFEWLSNKRIYVKMRFNGRSTEFIVDFDDEGEKIKSETFRITSEGYIVDILKTAPNHVLFAKKKPFKKVSYQLYHIKINDLINKNFDAGVEYQEPPGNVSSYAYDRSTYNIIAYTHSKDDESITLKYRKLKTQRWQTLITLESGDYVFRPINFINESSVAILTNKESDKVALYEFNIEQKKIVKELYTHPKYDLIGASVKDDVVEKVAYLEHGRLTHHYITPSSEIKHASIDKAIQEQGWFVQATNTKNGISLIRSFSSDSPGAYYFYNSQTDSVSKISSILPKLDEYTFTPNERIPIKIEDNLEIESFLTIPQTNNLNVLLVMPHGGPIGIRDHDHFSKSVQYLANRGFSVLRVNYRGSGGFGKAFLESGVAQFGKQIESDISAAVEQINKQYHFDKVCTLGSSYGGYSALMLQIQNPDIYDCAVATYGVYDLPLLFNSSNIKVQEEHRESVEAVVGKNSNALFDVSPVYLADKINIPALLIGGRDDKTAAFEHTFRMSYVLQKENKEVETLFYDDTGHGHQNWWGEMHENAYIVDYLYRVLDIQPQDNNSLSDDDKESLSEDLMRLADAYNFESKIASDEEKAFRLYKAAAELEDSRANYNIGSFFHRGRVVKKDISEALKWYKKSANLDFPSAHSRLGNIYYDGELVEKDYALAMSHLQQAKDLGDNADVVIKLAELFCFGHGVKEDIDQCLNLLTLSNLTDDNKITKNTKSLRNRTLAKVLLERKANNDVKEYFKRLLSNEYHVEHFPVKSLKLSSKFKRPQKGDAEIVQTNKAITIGENIELVPDKLIRDKFKKTAIVYRWVKTDSEGVRTNLSQSFIYGNRKDFWLTYELSDKELDPATWTLELFDTSGNLLLAKNYFINQE